VVYKKYQSILCSQNLTKAKASIAINNYSEALEALEIIDPSSSCYSEVEKLIAQISSKVDRKEKQEVELEKQRIDAIKEIGKAYYSNSIKLVKYDVLVH
jgi:chaperonin cofactor prefoldin